MSRLLSRLLSRSFLVALALFVLPRAKAQVVEASAGAGTSLSGSLAAGMGVTLYQPNAQTYIGGSWFDHGFLFGANEKIKLGDTTLSVGTQQTVFSFDGAAISTGCICILAKRKVSKNLEVSGLIGAVGQSSFLPWLQTARPDSFGVGVFIQEHISHWTLTSLDIRAEGTTLSQGISYDAYSLKFSASGGLLDSQRYFNGNFYKVWKHATFSANHDSYFNPFALTIDSVGVSGREGIFVAQANVNHSDSIQGDVLGESISAGVVTPRFSNMTGYYKSSIAAPILTSSFTENLTQRFSLTESLYKEDGRNMSFSLGGSFRFRRAFFSLQNSIAFLPTGYERITSVSVNFRVRDVSISAQNITDPYGKNHWLAYSDTYMRHTLPWQEKDTPIATGRYILKGVCQDELAHPVQGCSVEVGKFVAYSNSRGEFSLRVKKNQKYPVVVKPSDFISNQDYALVSAPAEASPSDVIKVVVKAQ